MEKKVLVAYASKHGATKEIADKIGQALKQAGLQADVLAVNKISDLKQYNAAVLGSAVYIGMWRKDFVKFLAANENQLAAMPVWLFSSGPMAEGDPKELSQGWLFPTAQKATVEAIKPRDITIFQGVINPAKMGMLEKWVIKRVKAPTGDFRDWDAITKWAEGIAEEMK